MTLFNKTIISRDHIASSNFRYLFDNQHKKLSETTILQALSFIESLFPAKELAYVNPVTITLGKQNKYDDTTGIILTKWGADAGALLHEFTHHVAMQNLPCFKKYNDIFLAKTLQLVYLWQQGLSFRDDLENYEGGKKGLFLGEAFAAQHPSHDEKTFLIKIDELLDQEYASANQNLYDNYLIGAFVFGVIAGSEFSTQQAIALLQKIAQHSFPTLQKIDTP